MEHLLDPTDAFALKNFKPGFATLFVAGASSLAAIGSSSSSTGSLWLPPASAIGTAGSTPTGPLSVYDEQIIAASPFTGCWSGSSDLRLRRIGKEVFITITGSTNASGTVAAIGTFTNALPAGYRPSFAQNQSLFLRNNATVANGMFSVSTGGVITFGITTDGVQPSVFTVTAAASFPTFTMCYAVDT